MAVNKVAASFGVIMAVFMACAILFFGCSYCKHSRRNIAKHNAFHCRGIDAWIASRSHANTGNNATAVPDIEMFPLRRPASIHDRRERLRQTPVLQVDTADRGEYQEVPLTPPRARLFETHIPQGRTISGDNYRPDNCF